MTNILTNVDFLSLESTSQTLAITLHVETLIWKRREYLPPILTDYSKRYEQFLQQPPKSFFKQSIVGTALQGGLKWMSDKSAPKGLKDHEVERGYTKRPPIPYIPVEDEIGELVKKTSGDLEYKLNLPGETNVYHALWESGGVEAFLKHMMSAVSYVMRKGYFGEYEESKKAHTKVVNNAQKAKDLFLASEDAPKGKDSEECKAVADAEEKVAEANTLRIGVAEKIFALYKNLLSKDAQTKWSNIVTSQIRAKPWTDLKGKVHNLACRLSMQSFEDCVTFHLLTVFPQDAADQQRYYVVMLGV